MIRYVPKISVVLPLYETPIQLVKESINSILKQTFKDLELLVICNGVTKTFLTWLKKFTKLDDRVRILELPVANLVNALNLGIKEAKGKYIARQDGDDISCLDRLTVQWNYMETHPELAFCSTFTILLDVKGAFMQRQTRPTGIDAIVQFLAYKDSCFVHGAVMIQSEIIKSNLYSTDFSARFMEDYELWMRLVIGQKRLADNIPEYLYKYRVNPESSTANSSSRVIQRRNVTDLQKHYRVAAQNWQRTKKQSKCRNKTFNEADLCYFSCVPILQKLRSRCEEESIPYNIDGLDNKSHTWKPRFWEYSFAYESTQPKGVVLDAGSGFSLFPAMLAKKELKVYSIDLNFQDKRVYQASRLDLNIQADRGSFFSLPYTNGFFDVVYCISCLEHIKDYKNVALALKEFKRVLKPGGKLFITVDYHKGFIDYGQAGWKWSEYTRYYNWHMILEKIIKPSGMELVDSRELVDSTNWSCPPLYGHYTFAAFTLEKKG